MKLSYAGKDWWPQEFAVCMAMDAFRIALGGEPRNFTLREVIAWLTVRERVR
jgi:hypothetical protein